MRDTRRSWNVLDELFSTPSSALVPAPREPDPTPRFDELDGKADRIVAGATEDITKAFLTASARLLRDEDGLVDYSRLRDPRVREQFVHAVHQEIVHATERFYRHPAPCDELAIELYIEGYTGFTFARLRHVVEDLAEDYTLLAHEALRDVLTARLDALLRSSVRGLSGVHERDARRVVAQLGLEDRVYADRLRKDDLVELLRAHRRDGAITRQTLNRLSSHTRKDDE